MEEIKLAKKLQKQKKRKKHLFIDYGEIYYTGHCQDLAEPEIYVFGEIAYTTKEKSVCVANDIEFVIDTGFTGGIWLASKFIKLIPY